MLHVEGLRLRAGDFQLTIDEWAIESGQYLVLVGRSGAGKTMLLETVAGLHAPDAGRVRIDGRDVTHAAPEKRGIGFVYQDCWLFPHLTVRRNIDFGLRYHGQRAGDGGLATDALAETLHIGSLLDRLPVTLSGGERQRVALARALAIRPRLLFLDEPLGTLDPATREEVAAELVNCHRTFGMTTVHVTHDHAEARMMGDQVGVMLGGRLAQTGEAERVFRRPVSVEVARFLGCENLFEAEASFDAGDGHTVVTFGGQTVRLASTVRGRVMLCVRSEDVLLERDTAGGDGTIREVASRGAMVRLMIDARDLRWVSLISASQQRSSRFTVGEAVRVSVPSEAVHLLPMESRG